MASFTKLAHVRAYRECKVCRLIPACSIGNSNVLFGQPRPNRAKPTLHRRAFRRVYGCSAAPSRRFPAGCRQLVERSPEGSWPHRAVAVSPAAAWPAGVTRPPLAVRAAPGGSALPHRAVLFEVGKDGPDGLRRFDSGDDQYRTAAVDAGAHVDTEHALEALRPGHCAAALFRGAVVSVRIDVSRRCIGRRPFTAPRRRQLRAQVGGVGANTPWKRVRCARGDGTRAASLAMNSMGSNSRAWCRSSRAS